MCKEDISRPAAAKRELGMLIDFRLTVNERRMLKDFFGWFRRKDQFCPGINYFKHAGFYIILWQKEKTETALRGGAPEPLIAGPSVDERLLEFQETVEALKPALEEFKRLMNLIKRSQATFSKFSSIFNSVQKSFLDIQSRLVKESITDDDIKQIEKDFGRIVKDVQRLNALSESVGSIN